MPEDSIVVTGALSALVTGIIMWSRLIKEGIHFDDCKVSKTVLYNFDYPGGHRNITKYLSVG